MKRPCTLVKCFPRVSHVSSESNQCSSRSSNTTPRSFPPTIICLRCQTSWLRMRLLVGSLHTSKEPEVSTCDSFAYTSRTRMWPLRFRPTDSDSSGYDNCRRSPRGWRRRSPGWRGTTSVIGSGRHWPGRRHGETGYKSARVPGPSRPGRKIPNAPSYKCPGSLKQCAHEPIRNRGYIHAIISPRGQEQAREVSGVSVA